MTIFGILARKASYDTWEEAMENAKKYLKAGYRVGIVKRKGKWHLFAERDKQ